MIIGNIKSPQDLTSKRKLQQELLDLEIANEAELERRVKDFKNPNKPIPVAPEYKTNAQLQKDRIDQERIAIKNMEDLGFDYNKGAELIAWLSGSEIDRLVEFNANFKGIKKELTETTNPKLLTLDYIKNYLERFFEDLDVSFGRKMTAQTGMMVQPDTTIDELQANLPSENTINQIIDAVSNIINDLQKDYSQKQSNIAQSKTQLFQVGEPIIPRKKKPAKTTQKIDIPESVSSKYRRIEDLTSEKRRMMRDDLPRLHRLLGEIVGEVATLRNELATLSDPQDISDKQDEINLAENERVRREQDFNDKRDEITDIDNRISQLEQEIEQEQNARSQGKYREYFDNMGIYNDNRRRIFFEDDDELVNLEEELKEGSKIISNGRMSLQLLILLKIVIPSEQFLEVFKLSLPLLQRTELVKRYARVLQRIKAPTEKALNEVLDEANYLNANKNFQRSGYLFTKINKMLSFLTNQRNTDAITTLNRNYEAELSKSDKVGEYQKIKQINDRNQIMEREARNAMNQVMRDVRDLPNARYDVNVANVDRFADAEVEARSEQEMEIERLAREGRLREVVENILQGGVPADAIFFEPLKPATAKKLRREIRGMSEEKMRDYLIEQRRAIESRASLPPNPMIGDLQGEFQRREAVAQQKEKERQDKLAEKQRLKAIKTHKSNMVSHYHSIWNEIGNMTNSNAMYNTYRAMLDDLTQKYANELPQLRQSFLSIKTSAGTNDARLAIIEKEFEPIFDAWVEWKVQQLGDDLNYNVDDPSRSDILDVFEYDGASWGQKSQVNKLSKGLGLAKSLKKHFRDDEKELREIARDFNRHQREEAKIDKSVDFKHTRIRVGRGIVVEKQPTYKTFGKYVIHMGHLMSKNVANFKYPSLGSIPSIRPKPITDEYKEFIIETIENGTPNERQFRRLSDDEREHFERVCLGAGLLDQFKMKRSGDDEDKARVDRFNILRGEVLAGNNNSNVIKELRGLVVRFMNENKITRQEGTNMLMELSAI